MRFATQRLMWPKWWPKSRFLPKESGLSRLSPNTFRLAYEGPSTEVFKLKNEGELEEEIRRLNDPSHQLQEAIEVAGRKDNSHFEEIAELKGTISVLERGLKREREKPRFISRAVGPPMVPGVDIEALENELDERTGRFLDLKPSRNGPQLGKQWTPPRTTEPRC
jgi:hypothetical protein